MVIHRRPFQINVKSFARINLVDSRYQQDDKLEEVQTCFNKRPTSLKICSWTWKWPEEMILNLFKWDDSE